MVVRRISQPRNLALRYLIDHDCHYAAAYFPGELDSGRRTDPENVAYAYENELTIVTANGDDLIREVLAFESRHLGRDCTDLWGLIIVPNGRFAGERVLSEMRNRGPYVGKTTIGWDEVARLNLCVRVAQGRVTVRRLGICPHVDREPVPKWYGSLPHVSSKTV